MFVEGRSDKESVVLMNCLWSVTNKGEEIIFKPSNDDKA